MEIVLLILIVWCALGWWCWRTAKRRRAPAVIPRVVAAAAAEEADVSRNLFPFLPAGLLHIGARPCRPAPMAVAPVGPRIHIY